MFCPSCGKDTPEHSRFCIDCGKSPEETLKHIVEDQKPRQSSTFKIVLWILGIVIVYNIVTHIATDGRSSLASNSQQLINSAFTVKAGQIYYFRFNVEAPVRIVGRFSASGGDGNDIQAIIADADNFENWRNGHQARVLYSTDQTTVGNVDVPIRSAGTYYIGFSNKFSVVSDKTVTANISARR